MVACITRIQSPHAFLLGKTKISKLFWPLTEIIKGVRMLTLAIKVNPNIATRVDFNARYSSCSLPITSLQQCKFSGVQITAFYSLKRG
jgi:hypothetical protein